MPATKVDASGDQTSAFAAAFVIAFLCFGILFLGGWMAVLPCGKEEGYEPPLEGSPRAFYCDNVHSWFWSSPWLLFALPALVLAVGAWTLRTRRRRLTMIVVAIAVLVPVLWWLPAFLLSGG